LQIKPVTKWTKLRHPWVGEGMPATVTLTSNHNHAIVNAEALSLRKIDNEVRVQFEKLFDLGMSAAEASQYNLQQLDLADGKYIDSAVNRADAAINPSVSTISCCLPARALLTSRSPQQS
jgi:hypothetical protein